MRKLTEALRLVEQEIAVKRARCVIVDEGFPPESSLLGTRDGYLNLAMALLQLVADAEAGDRWVAEENCAWDDRVKSALYQLPTHSAWLVGASLFKSHAEFMSALSKLVNPRIQFPLLNDPQFQDPNRPMQSD